MLAADSAAFSPVCSNSPQLHQADGDQILPLKLVDAARVLQAEAMTRPTTHVGCCDFLRDIPNRASNNQSLNRVIARLRALPSR